MGLSFRAKGQGKPSNADVFLRNCKIQYCQNYDHLGILINCNTKSSSRISNACCKGWKSFYALTDMDISRVNPESMAHLYKTIVLPSILYGCELWNHTNNGLETSKHTSTRNYKSNSWSPKIQPVRYL